MEYSLDYEEEPCVYKYIYCAIDDGMKQYYLTEPETRYIHNRGGKVVVVRCREGDLIYVKAKINSNDSFNW